MDLDADFSDLSLDLSDADPAEILDNINDIDELEAALFSDKHVSNASEKSVKVPPKKTFGKKDHSSNTQKKKTETVKADDWLFGDDGGGLLEGFDSESSGREPNKEKSSVRSSIKSLMTSSTPDDILKKATAATKKVTFDDHPSFREEKKNVNKADDLLFGDDADGGGLLESSDTGTSGRTPNKERSRVRSSIKSLMTTASADDILKKSTLNSPIKKVPFESSLFSIEAGKPDLEQHERSYKAGSAKASDKSLSLNSEIGFGDYKPTVSSPSESKRAGSRQNAFEKIKPQTTVKVDWKAPRSPAENSLVTNSIGTAIFAPPSNPTNTTQTSQHLQGSDEAKSRPSMHLSQPAPGNVQPSMSTLSSHAASLNRSTKPEPKPIDREVVSSVDENEYVRSGRFHLQSNDPLALLDVKTGHERDLDVIKSTYNHQLELLRSSYHDLKARMERDLKSVVESYSARIDVFQNSMHAHVQAEAAKECDYQDEIKRLRNLHLQALEECRLDMDARYKRLCDVHAAEIESLKSSTRHQRNIQSMMEKVDAATEKLEVLSSKYEVAYNSMTRQSESNELNSKQIMSVIQNQLAQQQRMTTETSLQVQQTVSRFEGLFLEMNRKFEEQHHAIQASHSLLRSSQAALQEERKQFIQQITLEREHLRKAHRDLITLQSELKQNGRDDQAKLLEQTRTLSNLAERYAEMRETATKEAVQQNQQYEKVVASLNSEKIEFAKKQAKLEAEGEKVRFQREHLDEELLKFHKEKAILQRIQSELENKQSEIDSISQKKRENEANMEKIHIESQRIERERNKKLSSIQIQMDELVKQRQLLTEERQALAEERVSGRSAWTEADVNQLEVTPIKQRVMMSHPGSPGLGDNAKLLLWQHSARKDRSFLEDEQFFLESVGNSPYQNL